MAAEDLPTRGCSRRVSHTCRHFGISWKTFYKWKKRYEADGPTGLCDRHCRPHRSPRAFSHEVVSKVLYLRQHYHFGPQRIADYLRRFHELAVAVSSVHRILLRHGMNRLDEALFGRWRARTPSSRGQSPTRGDQRRAPAEDACAATGHSLTAT